MKTILILVTLLAASSVFAQGGQEVQTWWDEEYVPKIAPEQQEATDRRNDSRCDKKISYYERKVDRDPEDVYFQWQLKKWKGKCQ